jgi:hypothetical protein
MKVTKYTLLVDEGWNKELLEKLYAFVESDEVFQLLDQTEVEVCDDCQVYLTSDSEVIMDVFKCPDQQEFCLNCCGCEGHDTDKEGLWYV